jgi:hypothetical protein
MTSVRRFSVPQFSAHPLPETPAASDFATYKSEARVDIALLGSALFLQRFCLGSSGLSLDFVAAALIFAHQFASGRLLIQYDRLLWFLALGVTVTSSLLLNFRSTMLSSFGVFVAIYFMFTLSRSSSPDRYKNTLKRFQLLILILSCLGIAQFVAQFAIDGTRIILFFGMVPDFLLAPISTWGRDAQLGVNTIIPITAGSSLIKSNGIFLAEPSTMSQMAALGILVEVLEFRRPRYLVLLALGLLLSYSGTGITMLLLFLPFTGLVNRRAQVPVLLVSLFALTLGATGAIDLSIFTSRVGEFEDVNASGFTRFISSFWMAGEHFTTASLPVLLRGNGPATMKEFDALAFYIPSGGTWIKMLYEYGLIGSFVFACFLTSCFRRSRCPKLLIVALIYYYLFTGNNLLSTPLSTIMVVLCTLSGPEPGDGRINETSHYQSSLVAGSSAG